MIFPCFFVVCFYAGWFEKSKNNKPVLNFPPSSAEERELRKRIAMLQEYRRHGIRTLAEAEVFKTDKRKHVSAVNQVVRVRGGNKTKQKEDKPIFRVSHLTN